MSGQINGLLLPASLFDEKNFFKEEIKKLNKNKQESDVLKKEVLNIVHNTNADFKDVLSILQSSSWALEKIGIQNVFTETEITKNIVNAFIASQTSGINQIEPLKALSNSIARNKMNEEYFLELEKHTPILIEALARNRGVDKKQIEQLVEDGQINGNEIINALKSQSEFLDKAAKNSSNFIKDYANPAKAAFFRSAPDIDFSKPFIEGLEFLKDAYSHGYNLVADPIKFIKNDFETSSSKINGVFKLLETLTRYTAGVLVQEPIQGIHKFGISKDYKAAYKNIIEETHSKFQKKNKDLERGSKKYNMAFETSEDKESLDKILEEYELKLQKDLKQYDSWREKKREYLAKQHYYEPGVVPPPGDQIVEKIEYLNDYKLRTEDEIKEKLKNYQDINAENERKFQELEKEKRESLSEQLQKLDIIKSRNKSRMKVADEQFKVPLIKTPDISNMSFPKPQIEDELSQVDQINEVGLQIQLVPTIEPPKMSLVKPQIEEAAQEAVDETHQIEEKAKEAVGEVCVAKKEFEVQLVPTAPKMSLVNPQIEEAVNETLDEIQEKIVPVQIKLEVNEQELNSLNSDIKKELEKPKQAINLQKNQISSKPKVYVANASSAKPNPKNKPDVEPKNQVLDALYLQEDIKKFAETNSNLQKSFENTLPQSSADQVSQYNEEIIQTTNSISDLIVEQQGLMEIVNEALLQTKEAGDANQAYWENWIENMQNKLTNFNDMIASGINNFMNGFSNALFEIARGTQSVSDAFRNMLSGLVENTVRAITQMVAQYLTLAAVKAIAGIPPGVPTSAQAGGGIFGSYLNAAPLIGMSHAGFDEIPKTGTWLLEKGERVTTAQTSAKLDKVLDDVITSNYYNSRNTSVTNQINVRGNVDNRTASQIALETDRRLKRADRRFGNG